MTGPLSTGVSGGDVHALRLCEASGWRLLAPPTMRRNCGPRTAAGLVELRTPLDRWVDTLPVYLVVVTLRALLAVVRAPTATTAVVASTQFFHDTIPAAFLARRAGARAATYAYHLVGESGRARGLRSAVSIALERFSLAVVRRWHEVVFVDNEETRAALERRGFDPARLVMTANAYDPEQPLPAPDPSALPVLAFIGRFVEVKGVWDMVELALALREEGLATQIVMLGDGPLRPAVQERLRREGLESSVRTPGFVDEDEKWRTLRAATLFVAPSREEGWGIAVGEALVAGVPALVYDLPAYAHFGDFVERVPVADTRAFVARAVALLRDARKVEALRRRLDDGRDRLPRWADILARELDVLRGLSAVVPALAGTPSADRDERRVARVQPGEPTRKRVVPRAEDALDGEAVDRE